MYNIEFVCGVYNPRIREVIESNLDNRNKRLVRLRDVRELEKPELVYHTTPIQKLQSVLEQGLLVEKADKMNQEGNRFLCLSPNLGSAFYFAHHVHLGYWSEQMIVGAVSIEQEKLGDLSQDPLFKQGHITFGNIPKELFREVILADLEGHTENLSQMAEEISLEQGLKVIPIDYDLVSGEFDFR